ncbi:MAG: putative dehydrogenase [Verrucomicrobiales bacterium]|jgi:predicted dehydrogenase
MSKNPIQQPNRRSFIRNTAAAAGAIGFPTIIPSSALGQGDKPAPSERVNMGFVGIGNRGFGVMQAFLNHSDVQGVAVADCHKKHFGRNEFDKGRTYGAEGGKMEIDKKYGNSDCKAYTDFKELIARDDIDAVQVATPDHWHGLITLAALRAGKDVYCEKPVTHFFAEGQAVYKTVAEQKAIFTVGSQQRSDGKFRHAVNVVRNGLLGKITKVEVGLPAGKTAPDGSAELKEAPENYDTWCGPSPVLPYMQARHHWAWRWHTAYGRGQLMDWIGHHNDIAHWGLGQEATGGNGGPISVQSRNWDYSKTPDIYDSAWQYDVVSKYAGGAEVVMSSRNQMGCKWIGENGWIWVTRGKFDASNKEWIADGFDPGDVKVYHSPGHQRNFVDSVKSRKESVAPAENAHRSITPGHLAYVSRELGDVELKWDPAKETVVGNDKAQKAIMALPYRDGYSIEA